MCVLGASVTFRLPRKLESKAEVRLAIGLQRIGGKIERRGQSRRFSAELGPAVEAQFLHDLQGQKIALQNHYFGFQLGGIVIVNVEGGRIAEVDQAGIRLVDFDAAARLINRASS